MTTSSPTKAKAILRPKEVYCPSCHREMNYSIIGGAVCCVNDHCELHDRKFMVEMPTVEVGLKELE
jgi:hypothetical protein